MWVNNGGNFAGEMDELRIHDYALTTNEVVLMFADELDGIINECRAQ